MAAYVILSLVDISAIYKEIRAVCFSVLNHERTHILVRDFVSAGSDPTVMVQTPVIPRASSPLEPLASLLPTIAVGEDAAAVAPAVPVGGAGAGPGADAGKESAVVPQLERQRAGGGTAVATAATAATGATTEAEAAAVPLPAAGAPAAAPVATAVATGNNGQAPVKALLTTEEKEEAGKRLLSSPSTVSRRENIFLSSRLTTNAFKTWSQVCIVFCVVCCVLCVREREMGGGGGGRAEGDMCERAVL